MFDDLEDSIKNLGYEYSIVGYGVFEIFNFLIEDETNRVWEIINSASQADWEKDYKESQELLAYKKYGRKDLDNMIKSGLIEYTDSWHDKAIKLPHNTLPKANKKITDIFKYDKDLYFSRIDSLQRQYEGANLVEHVDNTADREIAFATIAYLNDNYTNGELFFSKLGIEIKPKAGSLMIFPGDELHSHGVKAPGAGPIRYVLPSFVRKFSVLSP